VVGVYTWDIAQTKVATVHKMAKEREYPLKCTIEAA
jgi:ATP-dependent Clp protease adaptor protein ClpS